MKYYLKSDIKVFFNKKMIRLRRGVWNYQEVSFDLSEEKEKIQEILIDFFENRVINLENIENNLSEEEKNEFKKMLEGLKYNGYLWDEQGLEIKNFLSDAISLPFDPYNLELKGKVLLITDNEKMLKTVQNLTKEINLIMDVLSENDYEDILKADLTNKINFVSYNEKLEKLKKIFSPYIEVICCFENLDVIFLRNLNRILKDINVKLILGFIDCEFMTFSSFDFPGGACFECLEQRILARDIDIYSSFTDEKIISKEKNYIFPPLRNILVSIISMEAYMLATIGYSHLCGKVVSIYLPVFEIQIQDLLRLPYCPACGEISKANLKIQYTSIKNVLDNVINKIDFEEEENKENEN